jgi:hypothetical protein
MQMDFYRWQWYYNKTQHTDTHINQNNTSRSNKNTTHKAVQAMKNALHTILAELLTLLLTSSDNCPPTLTLYVRPRGNPPVRTAALEAAPEASIFVSSRSWGTKAKAYEKSIVIASILPPLSSETAMSWQTVITWLTREYPILNLCWPCNNQLFYPIFFAGTMLFACRPLRLNWRVCSFRPANDHTICI